MFTLLQIFIQEQNDINLLYLPNDSLHDVMNLVNILSLTNYNIIMFTTTSGSINVLNDKDVRMLLVVDGYSVDQRSQLIFLLDLILISVITIHVMISQ